MTTHNGFRIHVQHLICLLCTFSLFGLSGCGAPFKVAPLPKTPSADFATEAAPGGLAVSGALLKDEERSFAQFDANLPLAGIIAVEVQLTNRGSEPVPARALKFELHDAAGTNFKRLEPKKALERLMKFYGKGSYVKDGYRQTREGFESLTLPLTSPLAHQEERRGFLFFEAKGDVAGLSGLTLSITGGASPIKLKLDQ
jgi:hypothetical protein